MKPEKSASPVEVILGYLNFSQGVRDPRFFAAWNRLWTLRELAFLSQPQGTQTQERLELLHRYLDNELSRLQRENPAFSDTAQAEYVLEFLFERLIHGYRQFHRDILAHLTLEDYCQPFLLARFCEAILAELHEAELDGKADDNQILQATIRRLNDYLGYRPVPTLEGKKRHKPYEHEFVCPIPLWIRGAGAAVGPYQRLIETALGILRETSAELCRASYFDFEQLEEIVLDPRGYDMEHPVHQRPNYLYGLWDPRKLNDRGYYCRFVLHDVHLNSILARVLEGPADDYEERLFEGAAVLAGTILMASGISGDRPGAILSSVQIDKWLQGIALVRDQFYIELLGRCTGERRQRLESEMQRLRQPFGATRQALNQKLAARRSQELYVVSLATCFAKMGAVEEARYWMQQIHSGAARIRCEIRCQLGECEWLIRNNRRTEALKTLSGVIELIHRGIECGALIDPWCILGFGCLFPIFEHLREGVFDYRVEQLVGLVRLVFQRLAALRRAAAASGDEAVDEAAENLAAELADWWDQFATTAVADANSFLGRDECTAATVVSRILKRWREEPEAAQSLAFWKEHAGSLQSAASYVLLVETLLQHRDTTAAMALLVDWASRADEVGLGVGEQSFQVMALRWFQTIWTEQKDIKDRWKWTQKFIDYLEANCESLFRVPNLSEFFKRAGNPVIRSDDEENGDDDVLSAAYEGVIFRDSAADGHEGDTLDDEISDSELAPLLGEISDRCNFLSATTLIRYDALLASFRAISEVPDSATILMTWYRDAQEAEERLLQLAEEIWRYTLVPPSPSPEGMMEFERQRQIRDALVDRVIQTAINVLSLRYLLRAIINVEATEDESQQPQWDTYYPRLLRAVLYGDEAAFHQLMESFAKVIVTRPILYFSLVRGGNPRTYFLARGTHRALGLLAYLIARAGWVNAAMGLLSLVKSAERHQSEGKGKVSEIEHLFEAVAEGIFLALVFAKRNGAKRKEGRLSRQETEDLVADLHAVCNGLLEIWAVIIHEIYFSTVETAPFRRSWTQIRQFIRAFGQEIFTPMFMAHPNLRAIMATGTHHWLKMVKESGDAQWPRLVEALRSGELKLKKAAEYLRLIIDVILENYEDYLDYNSMTTQSDYGQNLYILLDFLRLKCEHQRRAWMLKPFLLAHRVLVRLELWEAAEIFEEHVQSQYQGWSKLDLKRYEEMRQSYGIHLPGLYEILSNGFGFSFAMQHVLGLIRPAMQEIRTGQTAGRLAMLVERIRSFGPFHVRYGFHRPEWIDELENTIDRAELNLEVLDQPWEWLRTAWGQVGISSRESAEILHEVSQWGHLVRNSSMISFTLPEDDRSK